MPTPDSQLNRGFFCLFLFLGMPFALYKGVEVKALIFKGSCGFTGLFFRHQRQFIRDLGERWAR